MFLELFQVGCVWLEGACIFRKITLSLGCLIQFKHLVWELHTLSSLSRGRFVSSTDKVAGPVIVRIPRAYVYIIYARDVFSKKPHARSPLAIQFGDDILPILGYGFFREKGVWKCPWCLTFVRYENRWVNHIRCFCAQTAIEWGHFHLLDNVNL